MTTPASGPLSAGPDGLAPIGPLAGHGDAPGTIRGHRRHRDAGEPPCDHCHQARRAYNQAWEAARDRRARRARHDPTAIEAALAGHRVTLTPTELGEAIRQLNNRGMTDPQIATRLHVNPRTVLRHRHSLGIPAAVPPGHRHPPAVVPRPRRHQENQS